MPARCGRVFIALGLAAFTGCVGIIGEPGYNPVLPGGDSGALPRDGASDPDSVLPDSSTPFTCDDPDPGVAVPLPRLSGVQYENAMRDLIAVLPATRRTAATTAYNNTRHNRKPADRVVGPPNSKHGGYTNLDQEVSDDWIAATYEIALAMGDALTRSDGDVRALLGTCAMAAGEPSQACLGSFVREFGSRAFRRPLTDADVAFYLEQVHQHALPADVADVIALILTAPDFLYRVEHGNEHRVRSDVFEIDGYELAARLAFHFWDTLPDDALLAAAASGALNTPAGLEAQVTRLAADPRVDAGMQKFFREYLWLDEVPRLDNHNDDADYRAFSAPITPTMALNTEMVTDVLDSVAYTIGRGGSLTDLYRDRHDFARTPQLAAIYGAPVWDGTSAPVELTDMARVGLLSRPAFLVNGGIATRPIMKGIFVRMGVLCDDIPPPPANAANSPFPNIRMATTRQLVEALTEVPGSTCSGCHVPLINPLGFATENFDSLGRTRNVQAFFDSMGVRTGEAPINTRTIANVRPGDTAVSTGAGDLTRLLIDSGRVHACFARQFFRSTFARIEDVRGDHCLLESVTAGLTAGQPLTQVMRSYALRPEFRRRHFQ